MAKVKHIRYPDGKEEFVTPDKYHQLHKDNKGIKLIGEKEL